MISPDRQCARKAAAELSKFLKRLCPSMCVDSVPAVNLEELQRLGIRALLIDLDNTLVPWKGRTLSPEVRTWVKSALAQGLKLCIVSNTRNMKRLHRLAEELDIPYVRKGLKPRRIGFRAALELLDEDVSHAAVLGDQIFTDVWGGNRLGSFTILVSPLHLREFFGTKISRFFEHMILRGLQARGMLGRDSAHPLAEAEQSPASDSQNESEQ